MNLVTQLFAWIAVLFHVAAFLMESVLFDRPAVRRILVGRSETAAGVRLWAFNQGFYNLFLAAGPAAGLIAGYAGNEAVGGPWSSTAAPSWPPAAWSCSSRIANCGAACSARAARP